MEQSYEGLAFANLIQPSRGRGQGWPWVGDIDVTGWGLWVSGVALKFGTTLGMANGQVPDSSSQAEKVLLD